MWNLRRGRFAIRKNFARKTQNFDAGRFPCIEWKAGLPAGFGEKLFASEAMFDGNLREEDASRGAGADHQAVNAELDFAGADRLRGGEDGDFDLKFREFLGRDWMKAIVFGGGEAGATRDRIGKRIVSTRLADAATEAAASVERDEGTAEFCEFANRSF
jgi:hypothetical protein